MLLQVVMVVLESGLRLGSALFLRGLLGVLTAPSQSTTPVDPTVVTAGWLYALGVALCAFGQGITHHVMFFQGTSLGFRARAMFMASVHAKGKV